MKRRSLPILLALAGRLGASDRFLARLDGIAELNLLNIARDEEAGAGERASPSRRSGTRAW